MKETYKNILILVFAVILGMVLNDAHKFQFITDVGLVVSFFGILATFVVISNYAQAKEAKDKVEQMAANVQKIHDDLYDDNDNLIYKKSDNEISEDEVKNIAKQLDQENNQQYYNLIEDIILEGLAPKQHLELIKTILRENGVFECVVINPESGRNKGVKVRIENNDVVIRDKKNNIMNGITTLNESPFDIEQIQNIVALHKKIQQKANEQQEVLNQIAH